MSQKIISLSKFKADASRLINDLNEHPHPVVLTQNGQASAVVQDYDSYQRQQEALLKLMAQGEVDVREQRLSGQDEVFVTARARLEEGRGPA